MKKMQAQKKVREGGKEEGGGWREEEREEGQLSFEDYEGHGPILQKKTYKHRILHTISEISWISFIRIYES